MPASVSPAREPIDDLRERVLALADDDGVDARLAQRLDRKQRRMPAAPDDAAVAAARCGPRGDAQGVADRRAGQHAHAEAHGAGASPRRRAATGSALEAPVDDDDLVPRAIERRPDRESASGIVKNGARGL